VAGDAGGALGTALAAYHHIDDFEKMIDIVTDHLNDGKAVGWHQGRTEWGPRALGSSPILGDARNKEMQKRLNLKSNIAKDFALSLLQ